MVKTLLSLLFENILMSLYNDFSKKALNHYVFKELNELNELIN